MLFKVEWVCRLFHFNKIEEDAAIALIKMQGNHKPYETIIGRNTNFKYSDLSSAFQDSNPLRFRKIRLPWFKVTFNAY